MHLNELVQEIARNFGTPDMKATRASLRAVWRLGGRYEVAIDVVLHDESMRVIPVVEDLAAEDVSSNTPTVLVALLPQPIMAEDLSVEVVRFERGVVHFVRPPLSEEEHVMVDFFVTPIQPEEDRSVDTLVIVDEVTSQEIEVVAVELVRLREAHSSYAEVT